MRMPELLLSQMPYKGLLDGDAYKPAHYDEFEDKTIEYLLEDDARTAALVNKICCEHLEVNATATQMISATSYILHGFIEEAIVVIATCSKISEDTGSRYGYAYFSNDPSHNSASCREIFITQLLLLEAYSEVIHREKDKIRGNNSESQEQ